MYLVKLLCVLTFCLFNSFLATLTAPITIPTTSSVARTPKTVPPTKPPMVAAVADRSGVGSGWTTGIVCRVTKWRCNGTVYGYIGIVACAENIKFLCIL